MKDGERVVILIVKVRYDRSLKVRVEGELRMANQSDETKRLDQGHLSNLLLILSY